MNEIPTKIDKDKANIKPYRKYQLRILFCVLSFILFIYVLCTQNRELNYVLIQNDSLQTQLEDKIQSTQNMNLVLSRLEVNYVSLYQLDQIYTTDIIRTIREYYQLQSWIGKDNSDLEFYLCYKATQDGDNANVFHEKCGGLSPIVFLFETVDGYRFGAYTSEAPLRRSEFVADREAFLFSYDTNKQYKIAKYERALGDAVDGFPFFGEEDISIVEGFLNHSKSVCTFPQSYEKDPDSPGDYPLTGGLKNFRLKEMEVLALYLPLPSEENVLLYR